MRVAELFGRFLSADSNVLVQICEKKVEFILYSTEFYENQTKLGLHKCNAKFDMGECFLKVKPLFSLFIRFSHYQLDHV